METEIVQTAEAVAKTRNPIIIACAATAAIAVGTAAWFRRRRNRDEVVHINAPEQ